MHNVAEDLQMGNRNTVGGVAVEAEGRRSSPWPTALRKSRNGGASVKTSMKCSRTSSQA